MEILKTNYDLLKSEKTSRQCFESALLCLVSSMMVKTLTSNFCTKEQVKTFTENQVKGWLDEECPGYTFFKNIGLFNECNKSSEDKNKTSSNFYNVSDEIDEVNSFEEILMFALKKSIIRKGE